MKSAEPFLKTEENRDGETPASILVDQWYGDIGLWPGIPVARFITLSRALNITPYDLGRLLCMYDATSTQRPDGKLYRSIMRSGQIPPSIALNVAVLEAWHSSCILGRKTKPVIPIHLLK